MSEPNYLPFDGETYSPEQDSARMGKQLSRVHGVMLFFSGKWLTPVELEFQTGYNWASISARLRDLRKPKFGGHTIERRRVKGGLWEYRMACPGINPRRPDRE